MTVAEHEGVESGTAVVLVAEDDADCRETMCETLRDAGYVPCGADTEPETEWLPKPFDAQHLHAAVSALEDVRASRIRLQS